MKCGTTSLANYLDQHPDVIINKGDSHLFLSKNNRNYIQNKVDEFYQTGKMNIDKSASYSFILNSFDRLLSHNKDAKFIWLLRDPLERAYSNFVHSVNRGLEKKSFYSCFKEVENVNIKIENQYFRRSKYSNEIKKVLQDVDKKNILFLLFEDLIADPQQQLNLVHKFLNLPKHKYVELNHKKKNSTFTSIFYPFYPVLSRLFGRKFVLIFNSFFHFNNKLKMSLNRDKKLEILDYFKEDYLFVKEEIMKDISFWNEI